MESKFTIDYSTAIRAGVHSEGSPQTDAAADGRQAWLPGGRGPSDAPADAATTGNLQAVAAADRGLTAAPADMTRYKASFLAAAKESLTEIAGDRRISQRQLALRGDIAPSTMTDILTHNALPSFATVVGVIRGGLGMKLSEFFKAVEAKVEPAEDEPSVLPILMEKICSMPEESRVRMLGYAAAEEMRREKQ